MPTVTELKEERAALAAKLRELDGKLAACGESPGATEPYAPLRGSDRVAAKRMVEKWRAVRDDEPYDAAAWEELERSIGIYEYLHPDSGE